MKRKPYVREVRRPVRPEDNLPWDAHTVVDTHPWPEAQERADEIVTAWEAWHTERLRIHGEYVTDALDDAANKAGEQTTDLALRIAELPARTVAGFRVKLRALACYNPSFFYLDPPELPDPDQALSHSLWRDVRDEAAPAVEPAMTPTLAAEPSPLPAPIGTSLVGQIDFASGSMEDLRALWDSAHSVGNAAYAMAWTGRCHTGPAGEQHNAAGKLMQWLGEALANVADEARKEARRRRPKTPDERETRLTILAGPAIENGDPDEIAALAGEMAAHAVAERAGR
ncbi:hypothetical protein [Methylobacterium sp. CM6246]